jgi:hypothetical protein
MLLHDHAVQLIAGLRAQPVWTDAPELQQWLLALEQRADAIRTELLSLRGQSGFQPYRAPTWTGPARTATDGVVSTRLSCLQNVFNVCLVS